MPIPSYAKDATRAAVDTLKPMHLAILGVAVVGIAALALNGARQSSGGIKAPASTTESLPDYTFEPPVEHPVVGPAQLNGGYNWHPVRYPAQCGQEISALIHRGGASLRIPSERDMDWLTAPPGEVTL